MAVNPLSVAATGRSVCSPRWATQVELRVPYFRVYHVDGGAGAVTVRGKTYALETGFVYFIPGGQPFINHCPRRMSVRWLHGTPETPCFENLLAQVDVVLKWRFAEFAAFDATFEQLGDIDLDKLDGRWFGLQALANYVLAKVLAHLERQSAVAAIPRALEAALDFINREFTRNPPLKKIAGHANYAPLYFHRLFKKHFAVSPHAYMERKRMALAHGLLRHSSRNMEEIAELAGYQNVFYFSKVFKKRFGVSPGKVRQGHLLP